MRGARALKLALRIQSAFCPCACRFGPHRGGWHVRLSQMAAFHPAIWQARHLSVEDPKSRA
jgi:hypothetical protein